MPTALPFDTAWYLQHNPDVANAIAAGAPFSAAEHFLLYGRTEGRSGSPLFDTQHYLANNPDVANAVALGLITAWDHFELYGSEEGRSPSPLFDSGFYLQQSPDVADAIARGDIASAIQHFILYGWGELRPINPAIDLASYAAANPDVAAATAAGVTDVFSHLLQHGVAEGRNLGNGLSLADFSNDPGFTQALGSGEAAQALARVAAVAPFLPTFERPEGWAPPADTPIPIDFLPPVDSSMKLVVPPEVVVPDDVALPDDVFEPVSPPLPPTPAPVDDGGYVPPPAFTVALNEERVITFGGSATGDIMVTGKNLTDDTYVPTELAFTRGGHEASTRIAISEINDRGILALDGGDKFFLSNDLFKTLGNKLARDVSLKVTDFRMDVNEASVSLADLKLIDEATTGFVDATAVVRTFGTVEQAMHVMFTHRGTGGNSIGIAPDLEVMSIFESVTPVKAADLRTIEEATTGPVSASSVTAVRGSTADTLHVLVTQWGDIQAEQRTADLIYLESNLTIELTDAGSVDHTDAILAATTGVVTTKLIPGGTYLNFSTDDKIATILQFQNHTSQSTLSADGHLNWHWNSSNKQLTIETVDEAGEDNEHTHHTQTLTLRGIVSVEEEDGVFILSASQ